MVEPGTGKIKAMAVNRKFGNKRKRGETVINLAADQAHGGGYGYTAGSTFKVFTLAAALDKGIPIRTTINSPQSFTISGFKGCAGQGFEPWPVSNAGDSEAGNFNLRTGTWHSVNTFYAELERRVGLCETVKMAERFGLRQVNGKPLQQIPSQVLGANEVDVTSLAAAYAGLAARGRYCPPVAITEVTDPDGRALKLPKTQCKQVLDEDVADQVSDILRGVLTQGTAVGIGNVGRPAAGKTGTCEEFTCALFAGYTPNLASAVWYGDADYPWKNRVYGIYGATIPGPIWAQSMRNALRGVPTMSFNQPSNRFGDIENITVPDVEGMSPRIARSTLEGAGFNVAISTRPVRSDQSRGTVARTSPSGGTQAEEGTDVTVFISDGNKARRGRDNGNGNGNGNGNDRSNGLQWPFGNRG
jgi:membrane peptidoglycan carboxypeptidase